MRAFLAAGHHPRSPGVTVGPHREHAIAREIVAETARRLRKMEPMIVPAIGLGQRIAYINRWSRPGDFAIEVHLNGFKDKKVHGVEAFCFRGSGLDAERSPAIRLAQDLVTHFGAILDRNRRGVKDPSQSQHPRLGFVSRTKPWAVLFEVEFLTNPCARRWLFNSLAVYPVGGRRMEGWKASAALIANRLDNIATWG